MSAPPMNSILNHTPIPYSQPKRFIPRNPKMDALRFRESAGKSIEVKKK